jgi:hypothetical protein
VPVVPVPARPPPPGRPAVVGDAKPAKPAGSKVGEPVGPPPTWHPTVFYQQVVTAMVAGHVFKQGLNISPDAAREIALQARRVVAAAAAEGAEG